jgi:DNA-damage-inducible protein J
MAALPRMFVVDEDLEREASRILAGIGMSLDDAVRQLLQQVVHDQCLPFAMHTPNGETVEALEEAQAGGGRRYTSLDALFQDMRA